MRPVVALLFVPATFALLAACAADTDDDGSDGSAADITAAAAGCTKADRSFSGPGKVTATTSGVRCYDDRGNVVGSMGAQASVTVAPGTSAGANANPGRIHVTGTNTVDHKQLTCWMSANYLCKAGPSLGDAGADAGLTRPPASTVDGGAPDASAGPACGKSFSGGDCGIAAAKDFVAQCASAGGVSKSVQPAINGAIGAARCDCSCVGTP